MVRNSQQPGGKAILAGTSMDRSIRPGQNSPGQKRILGAQPTRRHADDIHGLNTPIGTPQECNRGSFSC
ncbi:hypothetical protein ACFPRL_32995 [Pseudoclavibacter helvolus]